MEDNCRKGSGDNEINHNPIPVDAPKVHLWGHKSPIIVDQTSYNNFEHDPDLIVDIDIPLDKSNRRKFSAKHKRISSASALSGSGTNRSNTRSGSGRTPVKSRSRPMKPHETEPFLTVDTVSSRMSDTSSARLPQRPSSVRRGRAPTVTGRLHVPDGRSTSPYINRIPTNKELVPLHIGLHLRQTVSAPSKLFRRGRNTPSSSIFVSPSSKQVRKPNIHIKTPFKQSMQKTEVSKDRCSSPAQDMKELTAFATFHVGKMLAREPAEPKTKPNGKLLKGKLKPLNTVSVKGPTIEKCRGIVSQSQNTFPPANRTLNRRREILERIPNVHEYLYDRPRTEESIHRTSRASSVDENRDNIIKGVSSDPEGEEETNPQTYQDDNLPLAPTISRSTDHAPTGPTPTPRMFVTEINNKGKENTPFDTNISSKVQGRLDLQQIEETVQETSTAEADGKTNGQDKQERPSTAGKLVRFAAEVSKEDGETKKDVKQIQNAKIAEGLRENTVSTEDTQMEMTLKVDITIVERDEKAQQEENKVVKGEITIIDKGEKSQKDEKKSKQSCKPSEDEIVKKDDHNDDDDIKDIDDNRLKENKSTNMSQSQSAGESGSGKGSKESGDKSQHGKQNSIYMCRNRDRYTAPSTLQIQSVLHDGSVYYTVGAESPRRSRSPSPSRSPTRSRSPSPFRSSSTGTLSRQKKSTSNKQDASKNKLNRLVRPSSANKAKKQKRRSSQSSQSSISMETRLNSESSEICTSRKCKVYFEGETPPRQSIFTETKVGDDVEITLKDEKPLSFDDLDSELIAIQESIRAKHRKSITASPAAKIDLNSTIDSEESELQKQIEEKIKNLELNSKCLQTDDDLDSETSKDKVQGYVDLLEMYRNKCMTVSENCGCISDSLTTPRPVTPKRRNSFSRPLSAGKKGTASRTLSRRNSFHFEKPTAADDKNSKTNVVESSKELFRSPSVVSMTTDSGFSFGAEDSKVPSLCLTPGDSDICLTDRSEDNEEKPLLEIVCDHLPVNEVSGNDVEDRVINGEAGVDFKIVAKALEFSKPKPIKKKKAKEPVAPFAPLCFRLNARPPSGYLYYFAYGPDMNQSRVSTYLKREVSCRFWGLLYGFQLVFNKKGLDIEAGGFANIEFNPFCSVEGVIYQITPEELQLLDKHVGYPEHYTHLMLPVWMSNSTSPDQYGVAQYCVPAVMYIAQDKWLNKDETLNCDYALQQCIKSSDLVTPDYRDHMVNYCQPIHEQVVCVS